MICTVRACAGVVSVAPCDGYYVRLREVEVAPPPPAGVADRIRRWFRPATPSLDRIPEAVRVRRGGPLDERCTNRIWLAAVEPTLGLEADDAIFAVERLSPEVSSAFGHLNALADGGDFDGLAAAIRAYVAAGLFEVDGPEGMAGEMRRGVRAPNFWPPDR